MSSKRDDKNMMIVRREGSGGPCGACRFLRRKCVRGCIFAPYFVSDQLGTCHFAAVHKVFGASNASKILLKIPPHKRPDAVVSLCYEALSRVSDPVYGCVSHIFTLQQQVDDLQAKLACIQARLANLGCRPPVQQPQFLQSASSIDLQSSSELHASDVKKSQQLTHSQPEQTSFEVASICNHREDRVEEEEDDDLQRLARELVAKYLPGLKFRSSN